MGQTYDSDRSFPCLASITVSGANSSRTYPFFRSFRATYCTCLITTVPTTTATVITVNRETKYGVTGSQIAIGTFTVPLSTTIGDLFYSDLANIADTDLAPGEGISFTSDGASAAGVIWCGVVGFEYGEPPTVVSGLTFSNVTKPRTGQGSIKQLTFTAT